MVRFCLGFVVFMVLVLVSSCVLGDTVQVYFIRDGQIQPVERTIESGSDLEKSAMEALAAGPSGDERAAGWETAFPSGTSLGSVSGEGASMVVNFQGEMLQQPMAVSQRELMIGQISRTAGQFSRVFTLKVRKNGEGFRSLLRPVFDQIPIQVQELPWQPTSLGHLKQVKKDGTVVYTSLGALLGKRIAISPGHGWTRGGEKGWRLQRGYWWGIVEDFLNPEFMMYLNQYLKEAGARVIPVRELDKNAGNGVSGYPKWQEAAKYYAESQGAPKWVYSVQEKEEGSDIDTRPLYAAWRGADILVSLHNNGAASSGTLTLYETDNGFQDDSKRLADAVHSRLISTIRKEFVSDWKDRKAQGFEGNYGENNWCQQPSILLEIAFMDTQEPDNRLLHDENFKKTVARAIYEGICDYFQVDPTYKVTEEFRATKALPSRGGKFKKRTRLPLRGASKHIKVRHHKR